jgi:hypothetical protein
MKVGVLFSFFFFTFQTYISLLETERLSRIISRARTAKIDHLQFCTSVFYGFQFTDFLCFVDVFVRSSFITMSSFESFLPCPPFFFLSPKKK